MKLPSARAFEAQAKRPHSPNACPRPHKTHEANHFRRREAVLVDEVRPDERPCPSEPGLAVHSNDPASTDDALREIDEFAAHLERGVRSIVKVH